MTPAEVRRFLDRAVRLALRGHGGAEPNPMVGCVLVADDGSIVAEGHHARCGEAHAEASALAAAGARARGTTAIVTLEPCSHTGRTGSCAEALIAAGVARVIYAVDDPHDEARGGARRLREAGIPTERVAHAGADELAQPFLRRTNRGRPWVTAKWAQTIDGAVALANGESKWISGPRSRAMVHRERGRVDAILTGIGTVLADDPELTPRGGVHKRQPLRVVYDPDARTPVSARVVAADAGQRVRGTVLLTSPDGRGDSVEVGSVEVDSVERGATPGDTRAARIAALATAGVELLPLGADGELGPAIHALGRRGISTILVEAGGGLVGRLLRERLLDEAWVFVAPIVAGSESARRGVRGFDPNSIAEAERARLVSSRRRGDDLLVHYRFD